MSLQWHIVAAIGEHQLNPSSISSCNTGALLEIPYSIGQFGTPWRMGNKRVVLIFLLRIMLKFTLGAFLISFEGVNILFIVEDHRVISRCRRGEMVLFLDNSDIFMYIVWIVVTRTVTPWPSLFHIRKMLLSSRYTIKMTTLKTVRQTGFELWYLTSPSKQRSRKFLKVDTEFSGNIHF